MQSKCNRLPLTWTEHLANIHKNIVKKDIENMLIVSVKKEKSNRSLNKLTNERLDNQLVNFPKNKNKNKRKRKTTEERKR